MSILSQNSKKQNAWAGKVKVTRLTPADAGGNVKAFASVAIGSPPSITINGCKIIQQPGQRAWVSMPTYKGDDGKWHHIVWVDNAQLKQALTETILAAWQDLLGAGVRDDDIELWGTGQ
jgi:DNA-binding cell septation regulator SpoVG